MPDPQDADHGFYLPGPPGSDHGDFWVGDTVRLHTGSAAFDYNEVDARVMAITITRDDDNGELIVIPELQVAPTVPCADFEFPLTPAGLYPPLSVDPGIFPGPGAKPIESDALGVTYYMHAGTAVPEVPTPFWVGEFSFPAEPDPPGGPYYQRVVTWSPAGFGDFAESFAANSVRLIVVGDGTLTVYFADSHYPFDEDLAECRIYDGATGTLLYEFVPIGVAGASQDIVLTGGSTGTCLHIIDLRFAGGNYFGYGGATWTPT